MDWNLIGFVKASNYRSQIMLSLKKRNKTPKELRNELGFHLSHISSTLNNLISKGLVVCLTPQLRKGKIFALTELGLNTITQLFNDNLSS